MKSNARVFHETDLTNKNEREIATERNSSKGFSKNTVGQYLLEKLNIQAPKMQKLTHSNSNNLNEYEIQLAELRKKVAMLEDKNRIVEERYEAVVTENRTLKREKEIVFTQLKSVEEKSKKMQEHYEHTVSELKAKVEFLQGQAPQSSKKEMAYNMPLQRFNPPSEPRRGEEELKRDKSVVSTDRLEDLYEKKLKENNEFESLFKKVFESY